jgi:signal peptidase I
MDDSTKTETDNIIRPDTSPPPVQTVPETQPEPHEPSKPETPVTPPQQPPQKENYRGVITTVLLFVAAILIAFLLTTFVFQQYAVDGPSMESTLHNGDRLVVVKMAKTWSDITGHPFVPARGNIIIFNESGLYNASGVAEKQLVKRVIGLPSERIVINAGVITIFNKQNPNGFDPDKTMPYGKNIPFTSGNIDETIPAGDVFVCGDNRPDSLDSRYFGPVPLKSIVGTVDLRIYPFNSLKVF